MQIAAHVLAYNVNRYITHVLRNMAPHVDRIYVAYSRQPFAYNPSAKKTTSNPTPLSAILDAGIGQKVKIIEGEWEKEEAARNACLSFAKQEGIDWLITQDADEFYTEHSWAALRSALLRASEDHFVTTWYNFWKSSQFVLIDPNVGIKQTNASFAIRCKSEIAFKDKRLTTSSMTRVLDYPCFHYGYVMSDTEMYEKLTTWGHTSEVDIDRWFLLKWLNWRTSTRNLHPIRPRAWRQAVRFPLEQPDFAQHFSLPVGGQDPVSIWMLGRDVRYDLEALGTDLARRFWHSYKATSAAQ